MKKSTRVFLALLFLTAWCLALAWEFTPKYHEPIGVIPTDTGTYNHSEIQVQELSESEMWYRMEEPRYLNED